ncbi:universal stress protein [Bermanella sp. R86510]|uniref:universal stress protein n=1 Tax=unclassified Bermanella TaxID=2627862 RepID=UPI0037C9E268
MIKRILFATDLGLYNPYLMNQLTSLALSTQAKVDLVHVIEPLGVFAESILSIYMGKEDRRHLKDAGIPQVVEHIRRQVIDSLQVDFDQCSQALDVGEVIVEIGQPADIIVKQARLRNSDVIVMGSHGSHGHQDCLLGSVASKTLRMAPIPVYILPTACLTRG